MNVPIKSLVILARYQNDTRDECAAAKVSEAMKAPPTNQPFWFLVAFGMMMLMILIVSSLLKNEALAQAMILLLGVLITSVATRWIVGNKDEG